MAGNDGDGTGGPAAQAQQPALPTYDVPRQQALRPPPLDVEFDTCNVEQWDLALESYAEVRQIEAAYKGQQGTIPDTPYKAMCTELKSVIRASIPEACYISGLRDDILRQPPADIIAEIKDYCTQEVTPAIKNCLRRIAREIQIERDETIDEYSYFTRHKKHRRTMTRLRIAEALDEQEYLIWIIDGLANRPSLQSQIAMLRTHGFTSIHKLQQTAREVADI